MEVIRELLERGADKYLEGKRRPTLQQSTLRARLASDEKGKIPLDIARHDDIKFLLLL